MAAKVFPAAKSRLIEIWDYHHYIFFRELSGGEIGVITILHENMDLPARIRDDFVA